MLMIDWLKADPKFAGALRVFVAGQQSQNREAVATGSDTHCQNRIVSAILTFVVVTISKLKES